MATSLLVVYPIGSPVWMEDVVSPSAIDDSTIGVKKGTKWFNNRTNDIFICTDPTEGAAQWTQIDRPTQEEIVPVGSIMAWPGLTAPPGWIFLDGSIYFRVQLPDLWAKYQAGILPPGLINDVGDGLTFTVADFQGQFLMGTSGSTGFPLLTTGGSPDAQVVEHFHAATISIDSNGTHSHMIGFSTSPDVHNHTITTTITPIADHTHPVSITSGATSHSHGPGTLGTDTVAAHSHGAGTLSTAPSGAHTHTVKDADGNSLYDGSASGITGNRIARVADSLNTNALWDTEATTDHTHTISGSTAIGGSHSHAVTTGTTAAETAHTHLVSGNTGNGGAHTPTATSTIAEDYTHSHAVAGPTQDSGLHNHTASANIAVAGDSGAGKNLPPFVAINWIMKV